MVQSKKYINGIDKATLGDLFTFAGGLGIPREQLGKEGIPYLHYGDMHRGSFSSVSYDKYVDLPRCNIEIKGDEGFLLKDGDIVFLDASEDLEGTSRCVVIDNPDNKPFIAGLHTFIARPKDATLSKWFKKYFTQTQDVQKQFERRSVGFKVYGVNRQEIAKINVIYPIDPKEQEKIAEILMKWDEAIEQQELLISKLEVQKKGMTKNLLTQQKKWELRSIKSFLVEKGEKVGKREIEPVAVGVFGIRKRSDIFDKELSEDYTNNKVLNKNQICFGIGTNSIVYDVSLSEERFCVSPAYKIFDIIGINSYLFKMILDVHKKFLSRKYMIVSARQGKAIDFSGLLNQRLLFPMKNQELLTDIFLRLEENIFHHTQKLNLLKQQRKALMQKLLTGAVRVKV